MENEIDITRYKMIFENIRQEILKSQYKAMQAVNTELPEIDENKKIQDEDKKDNKILNAIIGLELGVVNAKEKIVENIEMNNEVGQNIENEEKNLTEENEENNKEEKEVELANGNVETKVITKNPIADAYTKRYKGVKIKNETTYSYM